MEINNPVKQQYTRAAALLDAMHHLRKRWEVFRPQPPLKRGDIAILGMLINREEKGYPPLTTGHLAKLTRQSASAITQKVNVLEEGGYLRRINDEGDRRVVCVQLTPKGRRASEQALKTLLANIEQALDVLGDEKTDKLLELILDFGDAIDQTAGRPAGGNN